MGLFRGGRNSRAAIVGTTATLICFAAFLYAAFRNERPSLWLVAAMCVFGGVTAILNSERNAEWTFRRMPAWTHWGTPRSQAAFNRIRGVLLVAVGLVVLFGAAIGVLK